MSIQLKGLSNDDNVHDILEREDYQSADEVVPVYLIFATRRLDTRKIASW